MDARNRRPLHRRNIGQSCSASWIRANETNDANIPSINAKWHEGFCRPPPNVHTTLKKGVNRCLFSAIIATDQPPPSCRHHPKGGYLLWPMWCRLWAHLASQTTSRSHIVQKGSHIVHFQNHVFTSCLLCAYKAYTVYRESHHRWPLNNPSWLLT